MALAQIVIKVRAFLRAGYPQAAPTTGYVPLLALLPRQLSVDEVSAAAAELTARGQRLVDGTSIRVTITRQTNELPSTQDIERLKERLYAFGLPVDDQFGS